MFACEWRVLLRVRVRVHFRGRVRLRRRVLVLLSYARCRAFTDAVGIEASDTGGASACSPTGKGSRGSGSPITSLTRERARSPWPTAPHTTSLDGGRTPPVRFPIVTAAFIPAYKKSVRIVPPRSRPQSPCGRVVSTQCLHGFPCVKNNGHPNPTQHARGRGRTQGLGYRCSSVTM